MELKTYQRETLAILRRFLRDARIRGPKAAYEAITQEPEQAKRLRGYGGSYTPLLGDEELPYVCLRLPTGGGKTVLAAHSIAAAAEDYIGQEYPVVLWLVPSTTIRKQTAEALQNPRHPYRKALAQHFGEPVRVFDMADFRRLAKHDLGQHLCVFVGTIQNLRVKSTDGRKVYAHDENLEKFFTGVDRRTPGLEPLGEEVAKKVGGDPADIRYSFANLMHLHRPLMIVDEAHKAVTGLSREMQSRVNPAAVIEFTATPHKKSNILHAVSALELKNEQMIKLPVRLGEQQTWEAAVTAAIAKRAELAEEAERDREGYIRPIVLFQAQDKGQDVTVDVLKQHLIDVHGIDESSIAIATGEQRELDGIDLFDPDADPLIEFVITKEALKEGWDCSFAYVFCSVANIKSSTDAEQLLGRVLRMPYAKRRKSPKLNKAYAHLVSKSFAEAATALRDRLVEMGFEETEAEANIEADPQFGSDDTDGLWAPQRRPRPTARIEVAANEEALERARAASSDRLTVTKSDAGKAEVVVTGFVSDEQLERVAAELPEEAANRVREKVASYHAEYALSASPAERGASFVAPALMAHVQGDLFPADTERFTEYFDWSLKDASVQLGKDEFDVSVTEDGFEIDLDGNHLTLRPTDQSDQLLLDIDVEGWSEAGLVALLARQIRAIDIPDSEKVEWLSSVVRYLVGARNIPLAALMRCRFILARKLDERIDALRQAAKQNAYQACLFGPDADVAVSFENGFRFFEGMFDGVPTYRGTKYTFAKHFLGPDRVPRFDGKGDDGADGDEFKAAQLIDATDEIEYWVRNVAGHPNAFRLPVAHGGNWTYPDFVAKLKDDRILVVEYKGAHLVDQSLAKRAIGQLWQRASDGRGVYVLAEKSVAGMDVREQIKLAISTKT
ncbi:DEAD/DEAH box helicase family protein [Paraurantiacibacter namhicola]|uniref:Type III restriction enzyme, res subunit n=1 Tax=Paraurantiacibacter namhicola TaxID=645517 RepID=A0A1C7DBL3_9SPHN|nr:DEAD/DEAH box helicase family protein [Paraurantiacibacter namhicola]ANU08701.1 Type III restriction enzyme, res subunit [Paraurantiacibacter namhicola]